MGFADPPARRDAWSAGANAKHAFTSSGAGGGRPPGPEDTKEHGRGDGRGDGKGDKKGGSKGDGKGHRDGRRIKHNPNGERLEVMDWQGMEIVAVQKDFSFEHPAVAARSEEECDCIRTRNSIHVLKHYSEDVVPKPFCSIEEAPFPDVVIDQLRSSGLGRPTPLQMQVWPAVLKGYDLVSIAQPGSGETLAYVLPMLVHLMAQPDLQPGEGPIGVVLAPTWERCLQAVRQVGSVHVAAAVSCRALQGGEAVTQRERQEAADINIAVCTPGRLIALLNGRATNLRRATFIVLDQADELLASGFGDQVNLIMGQARPDRQALIFASAWPADLEELAEKACSEKAIFIHVGNARMEACKHVLQRFVRVWPGHPKEDVLIGALDKIQEYLGGSSALVFCNSRNSIKPLVEELQQNGYDCGGLHDQQDPTEQEQLLRRFQEPDSGLKLLVCTKILGRVGLFENANVRYIINYDTPHKFVEYIHRLARIPQMPMNAGSTRTGFSLSLLTDEDLAKGLGKELTANLKELGQGVPAWIAASSKYRRNGRFQIPPRGHPKATIASAGAPMSTQAATTSAARATSPAVVAASAPSPGPVSHAHAAKASTAAPRVQRAQPPPHAGARPLPQAGGRPLEQTGAQSPPQVGAHSLPQTGGQPLPQTGAHQLPTPHPQSGARPPLSPAGGWRGRGIGGRRQAFLRASAGRGLARPAPRGLEPPRDFEESVPSTAADVPPRKAAAAAWLEESPR